MSMSGVSGRPMAGLTPAAAAPISAALFFRNFLRPDGFDSMGTPLRMIRMELLFFGLACAQSIHPFGTHRGDGLKFDLKRQDAFPRSKEAFLRCGDFQPRPVAGNRASQGLARRA